MSSNMTDDRRGTSHVADEFTVDMPDGTTRTGYVALGDPRNPHRGELLTEDEEKRIDAEGRPVVEGLPWSKSATGLFMSVMATVGPLGIDRKAMGGTFIDVPRGMTGGAQVRMYICTTAGRPRVMQPGFGACLELPSDLGRDEIKRRYVVEWLAHTAAECLAHMGVGSGLSDHEYSHMMRGLAFRVAAAGQGAVEATGL